MVLIHALNIPLFGDLLQRNTASLYHRIFKVDSLAGDLQARFLASYLLHGNYTSGSLLERIIVSGRSPIDVIFNEQHFRCPSYENGVIDSLRYLLHHENFVKPWSSEYLLAGLLTSNCILIVYALYVSPAARVGLVVPRLGGW